MAWAMVTNFGRKVTNISWKAFIPGTSNRVSTRLRDSSLTGLQDLDCAILFVLLKTCKGLLTAAAVLVCPVKLADVDAKVIGGSPFPSLLHEASACPTGAAIRESHYLSCFQRREGTQAASRLGRNSYHTTVLAVA
jgi:hypothetical protein